MNTESRMETTGEGRILIHLKCNTCQSKGLLFCIRLPRHLSKENTKNKDVSLKPPHRERFPKP